MKFSFIYSRSEGLPPTSSRPVGRWGCAWSPCVCWLSSSSPRAGCPIRCTLWCSSLIWSSWALPPTRSLFFSAPSTAAPIHCCISPATKATDECSKGSYRANPQTAWKMAIPLPPTLNTQCESTGNRWTHAQKRHERLQKALRIHTPLFSPPRKERSSLTELQPIDLKMWNLQSTLTLNFRGGTSRSRVFEWIRRWMN